MKVLTNYVLIYCMCHISVPSYCDGTDNVGAGQIDSVEYYFENAIEKQRFGDPVASIELVNKGIELVYGSGVADSVKLSRLYRLMGKSYFLNDQYPLALNCLNESFCFDGSVKNWLYVNNIIASIDRKVGKYDQAMKLVFEILKLAKEHGFEEFEKFAYMDLGYLYNVQEDYNESLKYFTKVLSYYDTTQFDRDLFDLYINIGGIYNSLGNRDSARYYNQKVIDMSQDLEDYEMICHGYYSTLGSALGRNGEYGKSIKLYEKALEVALKYGLKSLITEINYGLGYNYSKLGNYSLARIYLERAERDLVTMPIPDVAVDCYKELHRLDSIEGDFKHALARYKKAMAIADSIYYSEKYKEIAEIKEKYEVGQKEKEIQILRKDNSLKELNLEKQRLRVLLLLTALIIAVVVFLFIYYRYKYIQGIKWAKEQEQQQNIRVSAVIEAQELLQERIAKDLHDGVGQTAVALKLRMEKFQDSFCSDFPSYCGQSMALGQIADQLAQEIRAVSHMAMPYKLKEEGLVTAIHDLMEKALGNSTILYSFNIFNLKKRYPEKVEINVYRVVQELVANIIKHAKAKNVEVQLYQRNDILIGMVEDDGIGFDPGLKKGKGIGLLNVQSRIKLLNGTIHFDSLEGGKGSVVTFRVQI